MSRIIANNIRHNDASADSLSFDSSARVGIGTSSPAVTVHAEAAQAELQLKSTSGTNSAGLRFVPGGETNALYIYADGSRNINFDNHATSLISVRSGGGITFNGDTADVNTLDDYEEGETTITAAAPNVSGSITLNSTNNKLWYRKIGSLVVVGGAIDVDSVSSPTGFYIQISGLPFVVSNTSALKNYSSGMVNVYNSNTAETGQTPRPIEIPSNGQTKAFILTNCANISSSTQFQFNFSYWTTA